VHGRWEEIGDRVWAGRFAFLNQSIGLVASDGEALVVDTRSSRRQAAQILDDVRSIGVGPIAIAVNTHHHWDHAFGNHTFRPATIWGHVRCAIRLPEELDRKAAMAAEHPGLEEDWRDLVLDPPDRTFDETAYVDVGGRRVELRYLGRGHTDNDVVAFVPDAGIAFAGDLVEEGAPPFFGHGFPLDWPETVGRVLELMREVVVPGHGEVGDRRFCEAQLAAFLRVAELARQAHRGELSTAEAIEQSPFGAGEASRDAIARGIAQLRGELV
jgi:glyoxylase-like metal-dependent hydrolase (beta-lactamase superfamily II)